VVQLAFDVPNDGINHFDDLVAAQAVTFSIFQLAMGAKLLGFALLFDPGRKILATDPQMIMFIPGMGRPTQEPISQRGFRYVQFLSYFMGGVLHRQQARCFDNHHMRDLETRRYIIFSHKPPY